MLLAGGKASEASGAPAFSSMSGVSLPRILVLTLALHSLHRHPLRLHNFESGVRTAPEQAPLLSRVHQRFESSVDFSLQIVLKHRGHPHNSISVICKHGCGMHLPIADACSWLECLHSSRAFQAHKRHQIIIYRCRWHAAKQLVGVHCKRYLPVGLLENAQVCNELRRKIQHFEVIARFENSSVQQFSAAKQHCTHWTFDITELTA